MLEIGSVIDGKYKILNQIGQGGMSVVYLALNERANKTWAIKEVRKDGVQDFATVKQGLIAETDTLKKLNHKYLPSIRDNYDSYGNEFVAYDSRNYVMDVDAIETWLKGKSATDRDIACWFTLAINEISARYGAQFSTNSLVVYFGSKSWYQNLGDDPNKIRSVFTSAEKSNFDNFGRKRNQYCKKLGISSSAKEYSYEDFNYIANNFAY